MGTISLFRASLPDILFVCFEVCEISAGVEVDKLTECGEQGLPEI